MCFTNSITLFMKFRKNYENVTMDRSLKYIVCAYFCLNTAARLPTTQYVYYKQNYRTVHCT